MSANDAGELEGSVKDKDITSPDIDEVTEEVSEDEAPKEKTPNPNEIVEIDDAPISEEDIKYRSNEIVEKKDNSDLFVRLKDVDKYEKEKERAKLEAQRKVQKEAEEARRASEKEKEKAQKEQASAARKAANRQRIDIIKSIFWNGWRKYLTIAVVVLVIAAPFLIVNVLIPNLQQHHTTIVKKNNENDNSNAVSIHDEAVRMNEEDTEASYYDATEFLDKKIKEASGSKKLYIAISYASFVYEYRHDTQRAIDILIPVENLAKTKAEKTDYYSALRDYYQWNDDDYNYKKVCKIIEEVDPPEDVIIETPEDQKDKTVKHRGSTNEK